MFNRNAITATTTALLLTLFGMPAMGHDGRRFEVKVIDNQIVAHGYISNGVSDMGPSLPTDNPGDPLYRTYYNTIHGHFSNSDILSNFAQADLPGYDVLGDANPLIGHSLTWTATGFMKWSTPAIAGPVTLSPLDSDEQIEVVFGGATVSSDTFDTGGNNTLTLVPSFNGANGSDRDLSYDFTGDYPAGEIYVIQSVLSTTAPGIADSTTVYTLLSPDGATMQEKLHHPSLYLESQLGTAVPEPATLGLAALLPVMMRRRRR